MANCRPVSGTVSFALGTALIDAWLGPVADRWPELGDPFLEHPDRAGPPDPLAAEGLRFLGIGLDSDANEASGGDRDISADEALVRSLVVEAREDLEIARQVRSVLGW